MKRLASVTLILALAGTGCGSSKKGLEPVEFSSAQADDARRAASSLLGANGRVLFVCGPASGLGLFADEIDKGFQPDGMKDGRLVFLIGADGKPDLYFRDTTGRYQSAVKDEGQVEQFVGSTEGSQSWVVNYPTTGVTETHNLIPLIDGSIVDFWTSNKPALIIGASAKLFKSNCVRA